MTGREFVNACKADLCKTQSRSANGKLYSNKYLKELGKRAYKGINKNGVFTKRYSYGVAGHCCAGVQAHFIWAGYECFVPRFTSGKYVYIWNTNVYRKWLMTEPTIYKDGKKIGKVDYTTNYKNAKVGAVAFKGDGKNKKTATHTCVVDKIEGNYVYTVDFNVSDGHGHNNGTRHKRHKKYFVGFANMPYPKAPATIKYKATTNGGRLNVRDVADSKKGKIIARIENGSIIEVTTVKNGWAYVPAHKGWVSTRWIKKQ